MFKIKSKSNIKIISFLIPFLTFIILLFFVSPTFLTNDDSGIQDTLLGINTGVPYPYHQFINVFLGYFECFLYNFISFIPWWWLTEITISLLGISLFNYSILNLIFLKNNNSNIKVERLIVAFIIILISDFFIFLYNTILVSFTVSPAILYSGAIVLLFYKSYDNTTVSLKIPLFVGLIIVFSSLVRFESGCVGLCFYFCGLIFFSRNNYKNKKYLFKIFLIFIITTILTFSLHIFSTCIQDTKNPSEFHSFNEARAQFMGYPHLEYEDDPEFFEKMGFYKEKYELPKNWCFLDSDVTEEYFIKVLQENVLAHIDNSDISENTLIEKTEQNNENTFYSRLKKITFLKVLKRIKKIFINFFEKIYKYFFDDYRDVIIYFAILFSIIPIFILFKEKKLSINFFVSFLVVIGMWLLYFYLQIKGRFPDRALLTIVIPMIFINSFVFFDSIINTKFQKIKFSYFIGLILIVYSFYGSFFAIKESINNKKNNKQIEEVINYVKNSNDIFIYDFSFSSNMPFVNMPVNLVPWGGSCWKSDLENQRYKKLGIIKMDLHIFENDNVYFISTDEININNLYAVLRKEYGCKGYSIEQFDNKDKFKIYNFEY